jgi:thioredoxin 1
MQGVIEVNASNFDQVVLASSQPVVVDFYAPWCGPCRQLSPILERLSTDLTGKVTVVKVNADQCIELAAKYNVAGLPTLLFFKNGDIADRKAGLVSLNELKRICEGLA